VLRSHNLTAFYRRVPDDQLQAYKTRLEMVSHIIGSACPTCRLFGLYKTLLDSQDKGWCLWEQFDHLEDCALHSCHEYNYIARDNS
jgi:hypothetical protein